MTANRLTIKPAEEGYYYRYLAKDGIQQSLEQSTKTGLRRNIIRETFGYLNSLFKTKLLHITALLTQLLL